jgi:predicted dehydrogenase
MADVRILAVCVVNGARRDAMVAAVNRRYGDAGCRGYNDFRELLARPDIDAVLIGTPDNWHALQTIAAAQAGKHIYCEKPLARTVTEGRAMVEAVRRHGVVFQHGTQQRSNRLFRSACELVRNGRIGELRTVRVAVVGNRTGGVERLKPPPDGFDYDLWLGPAPWTPYSDERVLSHYWFHIQDYSAGGFISGWGIHHLDIAQWGMGTDRTGPVEIEGTGDFPTDGPRDTPGAWRVEYRFATGPRVVFTTPDAARRGVTFEGSEGNIYVDRGRFTTDPPSLAAEAVRPGEVQLYRSVSHQRNWLDCIRDGRETIAPPEIAHRSQTICCLSDIAVRTGRRIQWDPEAERIVGDEAANRMLSRAMRAPWRL